MTRTAIKHPEVDETLFVPEAVVRVACPQCKSRAGAPCRGARFEWLAKGERRGFRYVQYVHMARQNLFRDWKRNGQPKTIPPSVIATYATIFGEFSSKIDTKTKVDPEPETIKRSRGAAGVGRHRSAGRRARRPARKSTRYEPAEIVELEDRRGNVWESAASSKLWIWHPYRHLGDYSGVYVYTDMPGGKILVHFGPGAPDHQAVDLEDAFEIGFQLVVRTALLDILCERARWRVRELERRYGAELNGEIVVVRRVVVVGRS